MAIAILIFLTVWASASAFVIVDSVGKPRKPLAPRVAALAITFAVMQVASYVYLMDVIR